MFWLLLVLNAKALTPELADAVAVGDCNTVVQKLPTPDRPEERLVVAQCELRAGHTNAALAHLDISALGDGPFADYGRLLRADALTPEHGAPPPEVLTLLEGLDLPGDEGLRVRLLRARALAWNRSYDAGRPELVALLDSPVSGEARLALGEAAIEVAKRVEPGLDVWRAAWAKDVRGGWDDLAAERLKAAGHSPDDLSDEGNRRLAHDRVRALQHANLHGDALVLIDALAAVNALDLGPEGLGWAAFRGRDYARAVRTWEPLLKPERSPSPRLLFHAALASSRAGDYDTARGWYERAKLAGPGDEWADFAAFKIGYLAYDKGDCAPAREHFRTYVDDFHGRRHVEEALWFSARCSWREGRHEEAIATWKRLQARGNTSLASGAAYWIARAHNSDDELARVISRWPTSGYAWYAADRLGRSFPPREAVGRPPWPDSLATHPTIVRAEALLGAGLRSWARAELATVNAGRFTASREAALAAAHAFIAAGDYQRGRSLARPYCVSPWESGDPVAQQACTPRPEASLVSAAAATYHLDPLVPYGIMTAESALDPTVTSLAGAVGLMQLMPVEAGRIHAELWPERPYFQDDLFSAPYNATLGTTELGMKSRELEGRLAGSTLPATVASYNGGIEAVNRWLAAYPEPPSPDEFSEDIGYTETRQYVKRVLGFTMAYRWVYGDASSSGD